MANAKRFPEIDSSPRLGGTSTSLARIVGKTVASVEFGNEKPNAGTPESEAIIIHFNDGSAVSVVAGPHARDLAKQSQPEAGGAGIDLEVVWKDEEEWKAFDEVLGM